VCCAVTGYAPEFGYLLDEKNIVTVLNREMKKAAGEECPIKYNEREWAC
jgi:hypothetical protein